ncbi:MAG TPA: metallophosphoesterase [Vicinamibacterales bacterium]|nr:metallophosphoesterase [Vicinamibacterales bacterium]
MRRLLFIAVLIAGLTPQLASQELRLPNKDGSVKFGVLGDTGTGGSDQVAVAKELATWRTRFKFDFVVMMGDNLYGGEKARDFQKKFEIPYKALLDGGVKFYAALGNHDDAAIQRNYKPFNMNGERYYSFKPQNGVRFFALDSNYVDEKQLGWLDKELAASGSEWKIMFFHHPLYSSGETHGSADLQRGLLEPVFMKYGVNLVLAGHEHFYERIKPQKGIAYFTLGSSAKLRRGDLQKSALTAYGNDTDYTFILMEIVGDELYFQTINQKGTTIDAGSVRRVGKVEPTTTRTAQPVVPQAKPSPAQPGPRQEKK